jgi:hypothetical protein
MKDPEITIDLLKAIKEKYHCYADIFIDRLCDANSQDTVLNELSMSNILILLRTKNIMDSKWVKIELDLARSLNIPIIEYNPNKMINQKPDKLFKEVYNLVL